MGSQWLLPPPRTLVPEPQRRLPGTLLSRTSLLPNDSLPRSPTRSSSISIAIRETRSLITTSLLRRSSHNVAERSTWWSWELAQAAPSQGSEGNWRRNAQNALLLVSILLARYLQNRRT